MSQPITIHLIIQFLEPYSSANTSQKGLQNYLCISENTAKNFRNGRTNWVNEENWKPNAHRSIKAVFNKITETSKKYNNHWLFPNASSREKNAMEKAFDEYLIEGTARYPWLSKSFKPIFLSSSSFRMPTFTFFLQNYIYLQITAIASEHTWNCHAALVAFMKEHNVQEDIIIEFMGLSDHSLEKISEFLASHAFDNKKNASPTLHRQQPCTNGTPFIFPFYIDSLYVNSIYEQLLIYTENELLPPTKPDCSHERSNVEINGLYIKEQPLSISDQRKLLTIIQSINNSSLVPMHMYDCLKQQPNKNLIFVEGTFRLMGIYDTTRKLVDQTTYEPVRDNLYWHIEYVNTGVDGTDFSHLEGNQYICEYARGRDTIYHISMNLSGDKFILSPRHMTHMVKRFGTFKLKVLGHLIRDSQDTTTLSIKPLAVFHES